MVPLPTSPTTTVPQAIGGGGNFGYFISGISPVSGVSGTIPSGVETSGPWYIERQEMSIFYTRVPTAARDALPHRDCSLSGVNTSALGKNNNVTQTYLVVDVQGRCHATSSTNVHPGPWQQPQKFTLLAFDADYQGRTYGSVSAGCLGPAGNITTAQNFYARRLLKPNDVFYDEACWKGYSFQIINSWSPNGQTEFMNRFHKWLGWGYENNFWGYLAECVGVQFHQSILPRSGGYSTSQDQLSDARNLINDCGQRLRDANLWDYFLKNITDQEGSIYPLPHYSIDRHDFS